MLKQRGGNTIRYEDCVISSFREQPKNFGDKKLGTFDDILKEMEGIRWYHGPITRNTAIIILQNNGQDGSYLMRKSDSHAGFAISVRSSSAGIKHYRIDYCEADNTLKLGDVIFYSIPQLVSHFKSKPVIGGESGLSDKLLYPYNNDAKEAPGYTDIERQFFLGKEYKTSEEIDDSDTSIAPREGILIKRGNIRKSWKERWFVVNRNYMEYFENRKSKTPIRTLDLRFAEEVAEDFIDEKKNCFRLVFPNRTFYMVGKTPKDVKDWVDYLQWKLDYYNSSKNST